MLSELGKKLKQRTSISLRPLKNADRLFFPHQENPTFTT